MGVCIHLLIPSLRLLALPSTEDKQRQSAHACDISTIPKASAAITAFSRPYRTTIKYIGA
ncbi:MAG TPA: hypothetical protein PLT34_06925 [Muribaculaceae bacterium]|nr:hypothetical protein [Muribaculaceae bacterium]